MDIETNSSRSSKKRKRDEQLTPSKSSSSSSDKNSSIHPEVVDLTKEDTAIIVIDATAETPSLSTTTRTSERSKGIRSSPHEVITLLDSPKSISPPPRPIVKRAPPPPPDTPPNTIKCPICLETCINIKKRGLKIVVTRCGHIFCDICLKKAISDNGRKCPKCRKAVPRGPTGIIEVFDVC